MTIDGIIWFTNNDGCFGIAYGQDERTKEKKAYIAKVSGMDERGDMRHIMNHGAKVLPSQIKELSDFFNAN